MSNKKQILDKISRNLDQLGISNTRSATSVSAAGLTISYDDASIQSPMGGVDSSASPFLGIGIANPGKIHITTGAVLASAFNTADKARVLAVCAAFANNISVDNTDTDYEIRGHADLIGMGQ